VYCSICVKICASDVEKGWDHKVVSGGVQHLEFVKFPKFPFLAQDTF
jgi:hypothetical protein